MKGYLPEGRLLNTPENRAMLATPAGLHRAMAEGRILEDSLMQYKLPTRLDMGHLRVEFESSYEKTGPFGAKSIGEIVINTPAPALAQAIFRATGTWHRNLPITPEKVLLGRDE